MMKKKKNEVYAARIKYYDPVTWVEVESFSK